MKTLVLCAALLAGSQIQPAGYFDFWRFWMTKPALECDRLEDLRDIVQTAAHSGVVASTARYKHINAAAPSGKPACWEIKLNPLLMMKAIEGYPLVEFEHNQLYDVVVLEITGWDNIPRYAAISRFAFKGNAI